MQLPNPNKTWFSPGWNDYELLDFGYGNRLERFGQYVLVRPDPKAHQKPFLPDVTWHQADAQFHTTGNRQGSWQMRKPMPEKWEMSWEKIQFIAKLAPYKHTGVFPEQAVEWQLLKECINRLVVKGITPRVLNLFAYTGIASLVAAEAGAVVTTVDASKPAMNWFRENQTKSGLLQLPIRMILEDAVRFVQRELKREHTYNIILMDPPAFGNGPHGEKWQFNQGFNALLAAAVSLMSSNPQLLLVNTYSEGGSEAFLEESFLSATKHLRNGDREIGTLALKTTSGRTLPTGSYAYWLARADES